MGRLEGKTAVILGASSEGGTGWCMAELFAKEGAKVYVGARSTPGLEKLASKIGGKAFRCDTANEDEIRGLAEFAAAETGFIDIAVNSAGKAYPGTIETLSKEDLLKNVEVNYFGQVYFIRQMAKKMREGGSITTILSGTAVGIQIGTDGYAFAKAAALHMVRYAAREYAPRKIRINAINPGLINSPMGSRAMGNAGFFEVYCRETPLAAPTEPIEIAETALWLAAYAHSVTGVGLMLDGGKHLGRNPLPWEYPKRALDNI